MRITHLQNINPGKNIQGFLPGLSGVVDEVAKPREEYESKCPTKKFLRLDAREQRFDKGSLRDE